jgi:hypothetical protein
VIEDLLALPSSRGDRLVGLGADRVELRLEGPPQRIHARGSHTRSILPRRRDRRASFERRGFDSRARVLVGREQCLDVGVAHRRAVCGNPRAFANALDADESSAGFQRNCAGEALVAATGMRVAHRVRARSGVARAPVLLG